MKNIRLYFIFSVILFSLAFSFPDGKKIPSCELRTLDGKTVNSTSISNNGKPMVLVFWITFYKYPVKELDEIADVYDSWKSMGVKLVAVSVDDSRTSASVVTKVNAKGWEYEFYLDPNQDFKRAMNVNSLPHTFIIDGSGKVVWEKVGFISGDEKIIYDELKKLVN